MRMDLIALLALGWWLRDTRSLPDGGRTRNPQRRNPDLDSEILIPTTFRKRGGGTRAGVLRAVRRSDGRYEVWDGKKRQVGSYSPEWVQWQVEKAAQRRRNPQFFRDEDGVVHPIRGTTGWGGDYDPEIAKQAKELRHEAERAEFYRASTRGEKVKADWVVRPPWAAGISNSELVRIARKHDVNPAHEEWWEEVGLSGTSRDSKTGRVLKKRSGELRYELEAGQHRSHGRLNRDLGAGSRRAAAPTVARSRARVPVYDFDRDLPW